MTTPPSPAIRNISDTALWAAIYRADETARTDALFRDPLAARLAGKRGDEIRQSLRPSARRAWPWITRTYLFDQIIANAVAAGTDVVVNLAAGLDTRPYRMALPAELRWIEVDLPDLLAYKEDLLKSELPHCVVQRLRMDLSDRVSRQELFSMLGLQAKRALVITEGLLIYLSPDDVKAFADDLYKPTPFAQWVLDLASPGLLNLLRREMGADLEQAGAPMRFGPEEGPEFFAPHGWRPVAVQSMLKTAARLGRLPLGLRLLSYLPEAPKPGRRPWSGVCLFARRDQGA